MTMGMRDAGLFINSGGWSMFTFIRRRRLSFRQRAAAVVVDEVTLDQLGVFYDAVESLDILDAALFEFIGQQREGLVEV